jgi:hypothetical protein
MGFFNFNDDAPEFRSLDEMLAYEIKTQVNCYISERLKDLKEEIRNEYEEIKLIEDEKKKQNEKYVNYCKNKFIELSNDIDKQKYLIRSINFANNTIKFVDEKLIFIKSLFDKNK